MLNCKQTLGTLGRFIVWTVILASVIGSIICCLGIFLLKMLPEKVCGLGLGCVAKSDSQKGFVYRGAAFRGIAVG
jgi:hypothetical protein